LVGTVSAQKDKKDRLPPELQKKVNKAIDKGVQYLKTSQLGGVWRATYSNANHSPGATALAAWALLECGVPASDTVIENAAALIRKAAVDERRNYHIALDIFFLDKLGDPEDVPLIESLGARLLASQLVKVGCWGYMSEPVPVSEQQRLSNLIKSRKGKPGQVPERPALPRAYAQVDAAVRQQIDNLPNRQLVLGHPAFVDVGDGSNTQFVMLALWVSQRYGIPAQTALLKGALRLMQCQSPQDGGWPYNIIGVNVPGARGQGSPAMTCAGLLGLTLGHANTSSGQGAESRKILLAHPQFKAGLAHLGQILRTDITRSADAGKLYYLLWSLERLGVICDLKEIGGLDWYAGGAELLTKRQADNGSWQGGDYANGDCDTCFALLFLTRANVARDLTDQFQKGLPEDKIVKKKPDVPFDLGTGAIEANPKKGAGKGRSGGGRQSFLLPEPRQEPAFRLTEPRRTSAAALPADKGRRFAIRGHHLWLPT
jgi:hypothetical protein